MTAKQLSPEDYPTYFAHYINLVETADINRELGRSMHLLQALFTSITEMHGNYSYAEGKWTVKQVLQHIIDTERIMSYRALCFARGEKTALPAYDENSFADNDSSAQRSLESLLEEHEAVRKATLSLFKSLNDTQFAKRGTASNNTLSVRALAYIIIGHEIHHLNVLKERYLGNVLSF